MNTKKLVLESIREVNDHLQKTVYVLRLGQHHYYVVAGLFMTSSKQVIIDTFKKLPSFWIRRYGIYDVIRHYKIDDDITLAVNKEVIDLMNEFGMDYVHGGSYEDVYSSQPDKEFMQIKMDNARGACMKCHCTGHDNFECVKPSGEITEKTNQTKQEMMFMFDDIKKDEDDV